ncbi:adenylate/guanylate cyclase domain-containing protein [Shimia aestuarii]|uniref:Adenylate cyclase, class 3 n=1 Tax=Shimia aestuarii TaxID=254406 RepID=A0A1I4MPC2_9RHOB|nr:adenylate/guanylate cyclase domain-containing protein [Shimia aestuarii]SFM05069.1 Adenylate cyclase, class 3 [Shimia aestuarii]
MRSRITTLMFVDMVGYSRMMSADQDAAIEAVRELKNKQLEPVLSDFGGEILKRMGDGWIIAFSSISAALDSAIQVQTNLYDHRKLKLRIGCHLGEIVEDEDDFYGAGVNITQRIQTEAPPGGVMVSEDLFRQLSNDRAKLLSDAGTFNLKNISQPVRLYQWRPAPGLKRKLDDVPSIAVQAFEFAPIDSETAAVAGDLRDQLIVRVSRRKGVLIFDASDKNVEKATYDLRGRLRIAGGRGRFTVTMTSRADARPVWSQTYEAPTEDIFAFCDEVLELAEGDLRLQTNAFDGDRLVDIPLEDLSVSELRARAANEYYKVTMESWSYGLALMERAISLNPHDAVSLCMRVEAQIMLHGARYEDLPAQLREIYSDDLNTAVIQSPQSDYVFWTRAYFRLVVDDDVPGARADLKRSAEINPAYLENYELRGQILLRESDFEGADTAFSRLIERGAQNPLQPYRLFMRGVARFCGGDFEGAAHDAAAASDLRPNEAGHLKLRAMALNEIQMDKQAEVCLTAARKLSSEPMMTTKLPVLPPEYRWISDKLRPGA